LTSGSNFSLALFTALLIEPDMSELLCLLDKVGEGQSPPRDG
jgi:hypothetical protein